MRAGTNYELCEYTNYEKANYANEGGNELRIIRMISEIGRFVYSYDS
jgi:hypothetical protein